MEITLPSMLNGAGKTQYLADRLGENLYYWLLINKLIDGCRLFIFMLRLSNDGEILLRELYILGKKFNILNASGPPEINFCNFILTVTVGRKT
jgi:hypothetical protein